MYEVSNWHLCCVPASKYALRLAGVGTPVLVVCRELGVSEAIFYTWKKKHAD